jgi:hypothetical protein
VGNSKNKKEDDSVFSKNHSQSVRYRLRQQQEQEAEEAIREYEGEPDDSYVDHGRD